MYNGTKIIGLCITRAVDRGRYNFIQAFNDAAVKHGYRVFIYHSCSDFYNDNPRGLSEKAIFDIIDYDIVDAVVIFKESFENEDIVKNVEKLTVEHNKPLVVIGEEMDNCINYILNYESGFEEIVRHIIEFHNVKDVCFIAGRKGESHSDRRLDVFRRVMNENGLEFDEEKDLFYGDYWWMPTMKAVETILKRDKLPEAIICANDSMAVTVCEQMKKNGIDVPVDIIVTGFDGVYEALSCIPPITTSKCNIPFYMKKMFDVIDKALYGENMNGRYSVDYEIDIFQSCGCSGHKSELNYGEMLKQNSDRFFRYQSDELAFSEMCERAIECKSPNKLARLFSDYNFYNLCIVLSKGCFDNTVNPAESDVFSGSDYQVLYKSGELLDNYPIELSSHFISAELSFCFTTNSPILFNALSFMGKPMGFVCFCFSDDYESYCKIIQYVISLNNTIGNYRLVNYLRYTTEINLLISKMDYMTGVYNRKGMTEMIGKLIDSSDKNDIVIIASVDIDGLKEINDSYGHENGDFAIKTIADAIQSISISNKYCGRFGGDEFVICAVVKNIGLKKIIETDVRRYIDNINKASDKPYKISASIGIESTLVKDFDFETILRIADRKMYNDKKHKGSFRGFRRLI